MILRIFSPGREEETAQIFPVNMFIGAYLRLEALLKMKQYDLVLPDLRSLRTQSFHRRLPLRRTADEGTDITAQIEKASHRDWLKPV